MWVAVKETTIATPMVFLGLQPALEPKTVSVILDWEGKAYTRDKALQSLPSFVSLLPTQDCYAFTKGCSRANYWGGSN